MEAVEEGRIPVTFPTFSVDKSLSGPDPAHGL